MATSLADRLFSQRPKLAGIEGKAILVVEDQVLTAMDLADVIIDEGGWVVGPATTVTQAKRMIERLDVDGAILDINLPDGTIAAVADLLSEQGVPFIIYSGDSDVSDFCKRWPQAAICRKPSSAESVVNRLAICTKSSMVA
ncbi:response regulator [Parvularcula sp. LCG005]|uniref:response regulator n=1 Tax=Parvularcula sp. LCG005 TaxID=3078805 RepID=UPI00294241C5|nr:response regulator [Parvularcula sp. LCG005]WOI53166.1 response regulator [Parvularcula sp. LCG005]